MNKAMRKFLLVAAAPVLMTFAASANSAGTMDARTDAQYDAAMKRCDSLQGNEKDVCEEKAKAQRESAEADAEAGKKAAEAQHDAAKDKRDANYDVAKEKCDAMSGDAKDQCIAQAKTKFGK